MAGLSLLDIHRQSKTVAGVDVYGISVESIAMLLPRFPELKLLMKGEGLLADQLMMLAPRAIAAIIAAGCGMSGDEKAEKIAANLPLETQLDFIETIGGLTFTNGFGPFVQRLERLTVVVSENFGKVKATKLPLQSKHSSATDTARDSSGNLPPNK